MAVLYGSLEENAAFFHFLFFICSVDDALTFFSQEMFHVMIS